MNIAKRGSIALNLDEALHNYVLFIPNFDGGRGIIMAGDRLLVSYGLKNKDTVILKQKARSMERLYDAVGFDELKKSPSTGLARRISVRKVSLSSYN